MSDKVLSETQALSQLEALFGLESISHPDVNSKVDVIPTGSIALDYAIGAGGVPRGRITQFAGKESSGKTFLALQTAANWQKQDPENCFAFIDCEYTYDTEWAEKFGIDNDRVFYIKTNEAEKVFQGLVGRVKVNSATKKETKIQGVFDMIAKGQRIKVPSPSGKANVLDLSKLGLIIVDSVAAMQPPMERTSAVGKQNMALMARFLSVELRKMTPGVAAANVAMIFINQLRVDPGKMFGNPEDSPGGRALKHACSLMVNLAPMSGADNTVTDTEGEKIGHKVRAKIGKNKVGSPYRKAEYTIEYLSGITKRGEEILEVGQKLNIIERPSVRSYIINGQKFSSKKDALEYISTEETSIVESIRSAMIDGNSDFIQEIEENPLLESK
jgi:recombination protein RecA